VCDLFLSERSTIELQAVSGRLLVGPADSIKHSADGRRLPSMPIIFFMIGRDRRLNERCMIMVDRWRCWAVFGDVTQDADD